MGHMGQDVSPLWLLDFYGLKRATDIRQSHHINLQYSINGGNCYLSLTGNAKICCLFLSDIKIHRHIIYNGNIFLQEVVNQGQLLRNLTSRSENDKRRLCFCVGGVFKLI